MLNLRKSIFVIIALYVAGNLNAQFFASKGTWKKQREEVIFAFGVGNFLGDLGGRDAIGTDYSPIDLEFSLTRPSAMIGYRYRVTKGIAIRAQADWLRLWGDDKLTKESFRNNRNLYFRTDILETSLNVELAFQKDKKGNRYHLKHTFKRRSKSRGNYFYVFAGIAGFHYNPKAMYQGSWVALQPLGTEGQGLIPGTKKYKKFALAIPMGLGYKITINSQWAFGFEMNYRFTFTDYIVDCSTTYYDNAALAAANGPIAAALADPNLGNYNFQLDSNGKSRGGIQRGDSKQNDAYMSFLVTGGYYMKAKRGKKKTRSKF
jgi:hypothetical protein